MSAFDLAGDHDSLSLADQARANPLDLSQPAGFFTGMGQGAITGVGRLLADTQRTTGLALGAVAGSFDMLTGDAIKAQEKVFEHIVAPADKLSRHLAPKPEEIGMAGQLLHGLIKIGGEAVAFGAPGVLVNETVAGTMDALDKGVDLQTAAKVGGVQGAALTAGVIAPMTLGASGLGINVLYGAGINLAQGVFQRGATSEIYAKAGRPDLAAQFKALDGEAMAVDAILGAAFAGGGRALQLRGEKAKADAVAEYKAKISEMLKPEHIDAALVKNEQLKIERSGFGLPADLPSRDAHVENLAGAIDDLMEGRPVTMRQDVGDMIPDEAAAKVQADVAEVLRPVVEPVAAEVTPQVVEDLPTILSTLEAKYPEMKLDVSDSKGPLIVSRIVFPKEQRGQGFGTEVMRALTDYADATGRQMALTPSKDFGGTVARLKTFYKELGFVENKGKNKDFSISETMLRDPQTPQKVGAGDAAARPDFDQFARKYVEFQPIDKYDHAQRIADAEAGIRNDYMLGNKDSSQFFEQLQKEDAARFFDEDGDLTDAGNARYTELQDEAVAREARDQIGEPQQRPVDFSDPADAAQVLRDYIDAAGLGPNVVGGSGKSRSKYFALDDGRLVRVSDHELPDHYVNDSDIEVLLPQDSDAALAKIKEVAASIVESTAPANSRELGSHAPEGAGILERPAVRADETGSLKGPIQSDVAGGGEAKTTATLTEVQSLSPDAVIPLDDADGAATVAEAQGIIADLETAAREQETGLRAAVACFLRAA